MKKIKICVLGVLLSTLVLFSCKKESQNVEVNNTQVVDTTTVKTKTVKNTIQVDTTKKITLTKYTLDELLKLYAGASSDTSSVSLTKMIILGEIVDRHEITVTKYIEYRDKFWGEEKPYVYPLDLAKLKTKLDAASDTEYIQFTFTDERSANDFNYQIVKNHVFNSFVSCFPVVLMKKIVADPEFDQLVVGKGIKTLTNPPTAYSGDFHIAMLKYTDTKKNVQFFDISEDPR